MTDAEWAKIPVLSKVIQAQRKIIAKTKRGSKIFGCPFCLKRTPKTGDTGNLSKHAYSGKNTTNGSGEKSKSIGCGNYRMINELFTIKNIHLPEDTFFKCETLSDGMFEKEDYERENKFLTFVMKQAEANKLLNNSVIQKLDGCFPKKQ